jgi:peptidoglycan DL-endopeptidase CwlO
MQLKRANSLKARILRIAFVLSLAFAFLLSSFASSQVSYAITENIDATADEFQTKIEQSSKEYEEANKRSVELNQQISEKESRINELSELIPAQETRASSALRELYFLNSKFSILLDWLLGIEDLDTAIKNFDYIEHIHDRNVTELKLMSEMKNELDASANELKTQKVEADAAATEAKTALEQAQAAREEAQRKAQEKAAAEAEQAKQAQKEQQQAAQTSSDSGSSSSGGSVSPPKDDGADWSSDKTAFVNQWAARIDRYLAGSPLAGQGTTFASAAWDYGVDPRWSPAISNTESSKGLYCFRPYNAWGWGYVSWSNWEEAIYAHVRGLSRGYGYTISIEAAKKYCPPNWEHWYNATSAQMNMI